MKCQKCGQNEVNFYYSSYINGAVTETHLCSECVQDAGYNFNSMFDSNMLGLEDMLGGLLPLFTSDRLMSRLMPRHVSQEGMGLPEFAAFPIGMPTVHEQKCECSDEAAAGCGTKADDEMTERRKLNMEMRAAVEREDFERAAELRDMIRGLETQGC